MDHLFLPLDPLEASLEEAVVVGHGLRDVGRARLVEGGVDGVRDGPLGPDEERVVAKAVSEEREQNSELLLNKGSGDFRTLGFQIIQTTMGSKSVKPVLFWLWPGLESGEGQGSLPIFGPHEKVITSVPSPAPSQIVCRGQTES